MKLSVQPSVNKGIWKILQVLYFLIEDIIHNVIYLRNLGNEYKITNFVTFSKSYVFIMI